jgi:hypothetical protein
MAHAAAREECDMPQFAEAESRREGKSGTSNVRPRAPPVVQRKAEAPSAGPATAGWRASGVPPWLRMSVESLSGLAMDDVRVHRNSPEPAKLGAFAYTKGADIHLGPGQERHLPHEAWHVVQQKQGRVRATTQLKGAAINDEGALEREADTMGRRAAAHARGPSGQKSRAVAPSAVVQRQPAETDHGQAPLARVRRSDIASFGDPGDEWRGQFAPRPAPVPDFATIAEWQSWARNLDGYRLNEKRRFKIAALLRSMIQRLPTEVWLPTGEILADEETETDRTITAGSQLPVATVNLRNKLYASFLSIERPAELRDDRNVTGLFWEYGWEAPDLQGYSDMDPFEANMGRLTSKERDVLYFLFPDEMLDWARRDVEAQESVATEAERRDRMAFGATAGIYMRGLGQMSKLSLMGAGAVVGGAIAVPRIALIVGPRVLALAPRLFLNPVLGTATATGKVAVGAVSSGIVGGLTGALEAGLSSADELASGEISGGEYLERVAGGTLSGAGFGALFGGLGEVASLGLGKAAEALKRLGGSKPVAAAKSRLRSLVMATQTSLRSADDAVMGAGSGLGAARTRPAFVTGAARPGTIAGGSVAPVRPVAAAKPARAPSAAVPKAGAAAVKRKPVAVAKPKPAAAKPKKAVVAKPKSAAVAKPKKAAAGKPKKPAVAKPKKVAAGKPKKAAAGKPKKAAAGKPKPAKKPGTARRNTYPDFESLPPAGQARAQAHLDELYFQTGVRVPLNRVMVAPWLGRLTKAGKKLRTATSEGWMRNPYRYWKKFEKDFGADFALLGPGRTVSPALAKKWGWSQKTVGQKLEHHHIKNGDLVVPFPADLHGGDKLRDAWEKIHAAWKIEAKP